MIQDPLLLTTLYITLCTVQPTAALRRSVHRGSSAPLTNSFSRRKKNTRGICVFKKKHTHARTHAEALGRAKHARPTGRTRNQAPLDTGGSDYSPRESYVSFTTPIRGVRIATDQRLPPSSANAFRIYIYRLRVTILLNVPTLWTLYLDYE